MNTKVLMNFYFQKFLNVIREQLIFRRNFYFIIKGLMKSISIVSLLLSNPVNLLN